MSFNNVSFLNRLRNGKNPHFTVGIFICNKNRLSIVCTVGFESVTILYKPFCLHLSL